MSGSRSTVGSPKRRSRSPRRREPIPSWPGPACSMPRTRRHRSRCCGRRRQRTRICLDSPMTDFNKTKPEIEFYEGGAPEELVSIDIEIGTGAEATPGATVDVHYLGVDLETGEEFDSSWSRGQSVNFPLRSLIAGGHPRQEGRWTAPAHRAAASRIRPGRRRTPALRAHAHLRDRPPRRELRLQTGTLEAVKTFDDLFLELGERATTR